MGVGKEDTGVQVLICLLPVYDITSQELRALERYQIVKEGSGSNMFEAHVSYPELKCQVYKYGATGKTGFGDMLEHGCDELALRDSDTH